MNSSWYTPPAFVPIKYVPAPKKAEIQARSVSCLHTIAEPPAAGPHPGSLTNHWCLYLETGEGESVCVNAQPNPQQGATTIEGGFKADVIVSLMPYAMAIDKAHHVSMSVIEGATVGRLIDRLVESGRDRYEFNADGVGCRNWVTDTLTLLTQEKWLRVEEVEVAKADIRKLWPEGTPLEIDNGGYYD
ncbi:uncharacterized protein K489DRAFT_405001 [Dissoconium aciculare CBS 342.82]|uniref:DUF7770 domain-containing protein n=1 Tax=Dissoconium aciculare CBS 342.82 TaxID=1314786 RepID=A0A6J3LUW9_9PEZI|nr:uncharacterized protein K489DRAFT_405001 [Dissoconium aciculare CBS 342.82]KAF1818422.1 hypothetical protein K489DRAFT_405001 [Dissoconium aciculare CBS 342.82]